MKKFIAILFIVGHSLLSSGQKTIKAICYPGIQVELDSNLWTPEYTVPALPDVLGAQLFIHAKDLSRKEIVVTTFSAADAQQSAAEAFRTLYPTWALDMVQQDSVSGFQVWSKGEGVMWAMKQMDDVKYALVVFVALDLRKKIFKKQFDALLKSIKFLSLKELDSAVGYPLSNFNAEEREAFYELRFRRKNEYRQQFVFNSSLKEKEFSGLTIRDFVSCEEGFSFAAFEEERIRLNKGLFTESESLDILFLGWRRKLVPKLYWELNSRGIPGFQLEGSETGQKLTAKLLMRNVVITDDSISLTEYLTPREMEDLRYMVLDNVTQNEFYRFGRTENGIHFFIFRKMANGLWEKEHTTLTRPIPNESVRSGSILKDMSLKIDTDLFVFNLDSLRSLEKLVVSSFQVHPDQLLLKKWPEYYVLESDEKVSFHPYTYLPADTENKVFVFPVECSHHRFTYNHNPELYSDAIYTENGVFNCAITDEKGELISDSIWSIDDLQTKLLSKHPNDRYYFTGLKYYDVNQDGKLEIISGWFNNGRTIIGEVVGFDKMKLTSAQVSAISNALDSDHLLEASKRMADDRFKGIMDFKRYMKWLKTMRREEYLLMKGLTEQEPQRRHDYVAGPPSMRDEAMDPNEIVLFPEFPASYPRGETELKNDIQRYIIYPEIMEEMNIQGKVIVSFVVEKDGTVSGAKVLRGVSGGEPLDREALRVIKNLPDRFIPAKHRGVIVRSQVTMPIVFSLR